MVQLANQDYNLIAFTETSGKTEMDMITEIIEEIEQEDPVQEEAEQTPLKVNMELLFNFDQFELIFGLHGQPTKEEIENGYMDQNVEKVSLKDVDSYIFEINGLNLSFLTDKEQESMLLTTSLNQIEVREKLVAEEATVFNKIFYWRSKKKAEQQVKAMLNMITKDEQSMFGEISSQNMTISLDIQHSSFMVNLESIKRVIMNVGSLFDMMSFMTSSHNY